MTLNRKSSFLPGLEWFVVNAASVSKPKIELNTMINGFLEKIDFLTAKSKG